MDEKSPFQEKKIPVSDLYEALQHNEKLDKIPDTIETNRIYRVALASNTKDAYKFDKYAWKNTRRTPYPKNNPEFIKIYYSCVNADKKKDGRCVKHVFISKVNDLDVLVCYFGNFYIAEKRPHGSCRLENSHVFHHTPASTIAQIDELVSKMPGAAAYKILVATNGDVEAPRNAAQCQYRRQKYLKNQKITCDEIKNLILLSYELNGFYKLLQLQPETSIVLMHDQMKQQFANLLTKTKEIIPLYYDTTFSLGEIYVSILGFRHVMFSEKPILTLAILMHDSKRELVHERFVQIINHELPDLHKKSILVTDGENALKNAFQTHYPTMLQLRCWNHAIKDIKLTAKRYYYNDQENHANDDDSVPKTKKEIIADVMDSITNLLRVSTRAEPLAEFQNILQSWPIKFRKYMETYILPIIDELGGWSSRPFNLFDEVSGVTTNPIESLNAVFKQWVSWKELSLDALVQMFYLVMGFYVNETRRGFCAHGGYHLELKYKDAQTDTSLLSLIAGFSPDDAVARMKSFLLKRQASTTNDNSQRVALEKEMASCNLNDNYDEHGEESTVEQGRNDHTSTTNSSPNNANSVQQETLTNIARAAILLEQNLVQFHMDSKVFTVRSLDHHLVHAVHMNDPKRLFRCSCPSTLQTCSHILAVKLFLGMPTDKRDNNINLGHERKRKRIDDKITKPGGKRPRRCDKEPTKKYTSPYFQGTQGNTTNVNQTRQGNVSHSQRDEPINSPAISRGLTNITNLPSSSTSNVVTPSRIQSIRFLTPINIRLPIQQLNQTVISNPN
ncbi:unnamed protein product [Rotaria socialis]|uniref:SWIM-type domain-containing protein n=1 Tax=Rotaria socialis TaxID=392032 RepID=A0A817X4L6_9BILA|nr:unnamed protein product [Rotaria socialis]